MTNDTWEGMRHNLMLRLPRLLDRALSAYAYFANMTPPEGAKDFAAFQANCRAALAHIHLLIKLAQWAQSVIGDGSQPSAVNDDHIQQLIDEAETALSRYTPDEF